jgi:hypothetical protein
VLLEVCESLRGGLGFGDPEELLRQIDHGMEGRIAGKRRPGALDPGMRYRCGMLAQPAHQARLPDAWLARDEDRLTHAAERL